MSFNNTESTENINLYQKNLKLKLNPLIKITFIG